MSDPIRPGMGDEHLADDQLVADDVSAELASNRTSLSLFRTEASGDRTLMSVIRTSLSLISFGFTIFTFFHTLKKSYLADTITDEAPRRFGIALVAIGIALLCLGLWKNVQTLRMLKERRNRLFRLGLIRNMAEFHISPITAIAFALLVVGLLAMGRLMFRTGPF
jgi:putative membrane protein